MNPEDKELDSATPKIESEDSGVMDEEEIERLRLQGLYDALFHKATQSLHNPLEVNEAVVKVAMDESLEVVKDKEVPLSYVLDYAFFRLKIWLKCEITELDLELFKASERAIKNAPLKKVEGGAEILIAHVRNIWD